MSLGPRPSPPNSASNGAVWSPELLEQGAPPVLLAPTENAAGTARHKGLDSPARPTRHATPSPSSHRPTPPQAEAPALRPRGKGKGKQARKLPKFLQEAIPSDWATFDKRFLSIVAKAGLSTASLTLAEVFLGGGGESFFLILLAIFSARTFLSFPVFREYRLSWSRASSRSGIIMLILGLSSFVLYGPALRFFAGIEWSFLAFEWVCFQYLYASALFGYRHVYRTRLGGQGSVAIYGSGPSGVRLAQELITSGWRVECFIDDSPHQHRMMIDDIPILSVKQALKRIRTSQRYDMLVFAFGHCQADRINRRWNRLQGHFHTCKILPPPDELLRDRGYLGQLKAVTVEDLLARRPKDLDKSRIAEFIRGRRVMITGAGGSIGSELVRQCERFGAAELILLDHSELALYQICEEFPRARPEMVSVVDRKALAGVFRRNRPEIVLHAAAYKHVPMVEHNIEAGIRNNVQGTMNCIDLAIEHGCAKLVLISTDKAVRPTNVMGATKRVCELYAQNSNGLGTDIVAVRFGNVLGSSGSVIPKFRRLIEENRNITVTHPEITRYFMLIPEACALVLQAAALGSGGEIFILDMGEPVRIADLAKRMLQLSGRTDLKIEFTGLRPGEKLYEELLISDTDVTTEYSSITVARPTPFPRETLKRQIEDLLAHPDKIQRLQAIVPEFHHCRDNC